MKRIILIILFVFAVVAMAVSPSYINFNNGQVSPLLEARTNYQKYNSSCRLIENMFVSLHGSAERRPGTIYIADANSISRLIPFEYSTDDNYVLEFGEKTIRFFRDDGT